MQVLFSDAYFIHKVHSILIQTQVKCLVVCYDLILHINVLSNYNIISLYGKPMLPYLEKNLVLFISVRIVMLVNVIRLHIL